jgi:hypothetical protein
MAAPLLQAIRDSWDSGDTAQIKRVLAEEPCLKDRRGGGVNPLLEAARWGHPETLTLLLAHGAKVNEPDDQGRTPLYVAAAVGHEGAVQVLLAAGAMMDRCTGATRWTALHAAADRGHAGAVEALLRSGATINVLSATSQTPRDLACGKRHRSTVFLFDSLASQVLLLLGAQQRLAWALAGACSTGTQEQPVHRMWTLTPDLIWSVGSLLASAPSWMSGWSRTRAAVGRQATKENCERGQEGRHAESRPFDMSSSNISILAGEVARVERAARVGSLQRHERRAIRLGCE